MKSTNSKVQTLQGTMDHLYKKIKTVETNVEHVGKGIEDNFIEVHSGIRKVTADVGKVAMKLGEVDTRLSGVETRLSGVETRLQTLERSQGGFLEQLSSFISRFTGGSGNSGSRTSTHQSYV